MQGVLVLLCGLLLPELLLDFISASNEKEYRLIILDQIQWLICTWSGYFDRQ